MHEPTFKLVGETFVVRPFTWRDRVRLRERLLREERRARLEAVAGLIDVLPRDEWQRQFDAAKQEVLLLLNPSPDFARQWIDSQAGLVYTIHQSLPEEKKQKYSEERILELLCEERDNVESKLAEMQAARDAAARQGGAPVAPAPPDLTPSTPPALAPLDQYCCEED